mgnify:CR=1 FL=1
MIRAKANKRKIHLRDKRKKRVRGKIFGTEATPRLSVFKSNKYFYTQVIDDTKGVTLCAADSKKVGTVNKENAKIVAKDLSDKLKKTNIETLVFDKNGYKYHGVIASFADALRDSGIKL